MLRTKRLLLRNFCESDVDILWQYRNDVRCNQYQRYEDTGREYLERFVERFADSVFLHGEEQHFAIVQQDSKEMVGDLSVFYTESDHCYTLGITIAPSFQRQGYAFELLREVVARIQNRAPSADIVALIEKDNDNSISLFKKLGFVEECYAASIDSLVYTIYGK